MTKSLVCTPGLTNLLGVYCGGVFLYLHVMTNFVDSLLFLCLWYVFSV